MRTTRLILLGVIAAGLSQASFARPDRNEPGSTCLDIRADRQITISGHLSRQVFAGPPNYENIAKGDAKEVAFILELPKRLCVNDGGEFIGPGKTFDRVQIFANSNALGKVLGGAVGKRITVRGPAFGAHTGHHHAPLVLEAVSVTAN